MRSREQNDSVSYVFQEETDESPLMKPATILEENVYEAIRLFLAGSITVKSFKARLHACGISDSALFSAPVSLQIQRQCEGGSVTFQQMRNAIIRAARESPLPERTTLTQTACKPVNHNTVRPWHQPRPGLGSAYPPKYQPLPLAFGWNPMLVPKLKQLQREKFERAKFLLRDLKSGTTLVAPFVHVIPRSLFEKVEQEVGGPVIVKHRVN